MDIAAQGFLFTDRVLEQTRRLAQQALPLVNGQHSGGAAVSLDNVSGRMEELEKNLQSPNVSVCVFDEDGNIQAIEGKNNSERVRKSSNDLRENLVEDDLERLLGFEDQRVKSGNLEVKGERGWEKKHFELLSDGKMSIEELEEHQKEKLASDKKDFIDLTFVGCRADRLKEICGQIDSDHDVVSDSKVLHETILFDEKNPVDFLDILPEEQKGYVLLYKDTECSRILKVYHQKGSIAIRFQSAEERIDWQKTLQECIQSNTTDEDWRSKNATFTELLRLKRDYLPETALRYASLLHSLNSSGFYIESPLSGKVISENSGIIHCELIVNSSSWSPMFLVLDGKSLLYYETTISTKPCGVFKLRYAKLLFDCESFRKSGDLIIKLESPSQSIRLRGKHIIHLAEWIVRLKRVLQAETLKNDALIEMQGVLNVSDINNKNDLKIFFFFI